MPPSLLEAFPPAISCECFVYLLLSQQAEAKGLEWRAMTVERATSGLSRAVSMEEASWEGGGLPL